MLFRSRFYPSHGDTFRKIRIRPTQPGNLRSIGNGIKMHHLPQRMDPSIGSARSDHPYAVIGNTAKRRFQGLLHRRNAFLNLPSIEAAAIVFKTEGIAPRAGSEGTGIQDATTVDR